MARVYSKSNDLKKEYLSLKRKIRTSLAVFILSIFLWIMNISVFHTFSPLFIVPCFIGVISGAVFMGIFYWNYDSLEAGVIGEEETVGILRELPEDYYIVSNAKITYDGRTGELDNIVIGPKGVFVVETKNHNGMISGKSSDYNLVQDKMGRGGTPYSKQFYNPIKQVSTHVYLLAGFLKKNGINVWVQGIVYFANAEAYVDIDFNPKDIPVFSKRKSGGRRIRDYICDYKNRRTVGKEEAVNILKLLMK